MSTITNVLFALVLFCTVQLGWEWGRPNPVPTDVAVPVSKVVLTTARA